MPLWGQRPRAPPPSENYSDLRAMFHLVLDAGSFTSLVPGMGGKNAPIGLGTGFWFFHGILSFHVADFEYNPQNRKY